MHTQIYFNALFKTFQYIRFFCYSFRTMYILGRATPNLTENTHLRFYDTVSRNIFIENLLIF